MICILFIINLERIMSKINVIVVLIGLIALTVNLQNFQDIQNLEQQYVPIPKRYPGISSGNDHAPIQIELVYDPTCDGSAAFDQIVRSAISNLKADTLSKINFKYPINALPYHISSFKLAQAIRYVYDQKGAQLALKVYRYFLDNIASYDQAAILQTTINSNLENIASQVSILTGLDRDTIKKEISHYAATDSATRGWTKYVMGSLRIPGTPFMLVNGVRVDGATNFNVGQLTDFIEKLV